MPIDTSMYQQPPGNNLLGQLGQLQALDNAQEQNKLMHQQETRQNLAISQDQAQRYATQLDLTSQALAQVYGADNGNPTRKHIQDAVTGLIAGNPGVFDKDFAAKALGDLPTETEVQSAQNGVNPVKQWLISKAMMNERGRQAIQPMLPNYQWVDYGGGKKLVDMNPVTNQNAVGSQIQNTLSPEAAATPTTVGYDAKGQPLTGTRGQFVQETAGGGAPSAPGTMPVASGGRAIVEPTGAVEANKVSAAESAKMATELQDAFKDNRQRSADLANLEELSKQFSGGPYAPEIGLAKGVANQVTGGRAFKDSLAAQEEFRKISTQLAQRQMGAMGGTGSAEHLASAAAANPSEKLSSAGARKIIHMLQGNEAALAATHQAWTEYKRTNGGAASYGDFLSDWNKKFEPRAYQLQFMDKAEAAEMLKNMSPSEQAKVAAAYKLAHERGWLKPGQGTPNGE